MNLAMCFLKNWRKWENSTNLKWCFCSFQYSFTKMQEANKGWMLMRRCPPAFLFWAKISSRNYLENSEDLGCIFSRYSSIIANRHLLSISIPFLQQKFIQSFRGKQCLGGIPRSPHYFRKPLNLNAGPLREYCDFTRTSEKNSDPFVQTMALMWKNLWWYQRWNWGFWTIGLSCQNFAGLQGIRIDQWDT